MVDTLLENDRIEDLRASQRYRVERLNNTYLLSMSWYRADYLFDHPYRATLDVLERFRAWGPTTRMRSDGHRIPATPAWALRHLASHARALCFSASIGKKRWRRRSFRMTQY